MAETRSLGLDIGDRWIGVAMSDPRGILASPLTIIRRTDEPSDINAILAIIDQNQVGAVVVGLPLSLKGSIGSQAEKVQGFAQELSGHTKIPIEYRDESFTTVEAQRLMKMTKKGRKDRDDAVAAALILQEYLDEKIA
ncbi:MAG: Holliday junction resolvase RuvX [Dehalococcoidales bacterium]